jgi:tRNA A-37 threonylcarbamoyl transferase component Bud32
MPFVSWVYPGIALLLFSGCSTQSASNTQSVSFAPDEEPARSPMLQGKAAHAKLFDRSMRSLADSFQARDSNGSSGKCPPDVVSISGRSMSLGKVRYNSVGIVIYDLSDTSSLLKTSDSDMYNIDSIWREKSAMAVLDSARLGISPRLYPLDSSQMSAECHSRSLAVEFLDGITLADLIEDGFSPSFEIVRKAARGSILALEKLHSVGLLHGDISAGNIMYHKLTDEIKLIDFGRSRPYIGSDSKHVPRAHVPLDTRLDAVSLSPNELLEYTTSRADDLFRLADTLVRLIDGDLALLDIELIKIGHQIVNDISVPSIPELIERKKYRLFSSYIPFWLREFYRAVLAIGFSETPDYSRLVQLVS